MASAYGRSKLHGAWNIEEQFITVALETEREIPRVKAYAFMELETRAEKNLARYYDEARLHWKRN